ncbi:MAG TPA: MFS transporter [Candidatus Binataceae bacterium]|jgi:MHS family proline/betaine transporter-like MFS transporter|nr:MFS transporter [Candidatus Binataceae bacterium]
MDSSEAPASHGRLGLAGITGNVLEWYDFSVYGFFAGAIGRNFFPSKNPTTSLIETFGVFGAGFLMRPVGALLFGYLGDKRGRELALMLSVMAMAVPTFLIGVLPGYQQIGVAASIIMVVLRLVQGLSVGGEYTTSVVFLVERCRQHQRGLMGAYGSFGAYAGVMLGSAVGVLVTTLLPREAVHAWGWRIPFLLGITIGIAGYFIRRETARAAPIHTIEPPPLRLILRSQWRRILQVAGFKVLDAVGFYLVFVYATSYLVHIVGVPKQRALAINTISMGAALILIPLFGTLSDRIGRKPVLLAGALGTALLAWPLFRMMQQQETFAVMLSGQIGFAVLISMFAGAGAAASAEAFERHVRCSGVAVSHNLCMALLGGTAPMVATYLIDRTQYDMTPPLYLIGAAIVSALFVLSLAETARVPLAE